MGNGDVIGQSILISYTFKMIPIFIDNIYLQSDDYSVLNIWSSECMLNIWINTKEFNEGDYIYIDYRICNELTSITTVFIESVELNINYYISINPKTSQCLLCDDNNNQVSVHYYLKVMIKYLYYYYCY